MTGETDNPYRQRADAADEIRIEALRRPGDFKAKVAVQYFLPEDADLLFGEAVADAAVDAGAEGEMLARLGAVDDEFIGADRSWSSSRLPEMYHITTLSPLAMRRPASSVSWRAVRRMCSTGV